MVLLLLALIASGITWIWFDSRYALNSPLQVGDSTLQLSVPAGATSGTRAKDQGR
jgi:hypothetical protein